MRLFQTIMAALFAATTTAALGAEPSISVYPSGSTVPENLLRLELRFPAPLRPPLKIDQVKLTDATGVEIKDPFLDLVFPSPDGKRVIILFHPARVKTGVSANLALGRVLHAGNTITLSIEHPALTKPVRKSWLVTEFDAQSPQPAHWTFVPPQPGNRSPLILHLDKPISMSAEHLIAIRRPDGNPLAGDGRLENGETVWRFVPAQPWQAGDYALVTHPDLEDPAGNRPSAPFETSAAGQIHDAEGTAQSFKIGK